MIRKISIKNVASYGGTPATLETDKRVNLIYGLNGSGKTTLSNFLANKSDAVFSQCSIEGLKDEKVLVYNHEFVENNFYTENPLKGIFTLSSDNKDAEEKIKKAEAEIKKIDEKLVKERLELASEQNQIIKLKETTEEKTWEIKTEYKVAGNVLDFCLAGCSASKTALFDFMQKMQRPSVRPERTIEELKKEASVTQGEDAKKYDENEIIKIGAHFSNIESNGIFSDVIVGNENSIVAELIQKLGNVDWVKQGSEFLSVDATKTEKCPFCQQDTITPHLHTQIKDYFDATYQGKLDQLQALENQYRGYINSIPTTEKYLENPFIKNKESDFKLHYKNLTTKLNSNLKLITEKRNTPSQVSIVKSSKSEIDTINTFLDGIIAEIKAHNLKIDNKGKIREEIKNTFWQIIRWEYDQTIENYNTQKGATEKVIEAIELSVKTLAEVDRVAQTRLIEGAQKEVVNIDEAIANIKDGLKDLGISGFHIEKFNDRLYQIKRDGESGNQFKSLSEGEKTIISFLYFLELCKGRENESEVVTNKIVVIDDPISSLSHAYVFNVSQMIKANFFEKAEFQQVFVLTHSLYFFHELLHGTYGIGKENKLFRIIKSNDNTSSILSLTKSDIQNDYQSYWQIIKDHDSGNASDAILANSMRNILEHFFGFIEKEEFVDSINLIDKTKYQAFIRYVNRESHSDFPNITDNKEIDPTIFKEAFKEIFEKAKFQRHYDKMMEITSTK